MQVHADCIIPVRQREMTTDPKSTRDKVRRAVDRFFGVPTLSEERVLRVLEDTLEFGGNDQTETLLAAAITNVPALASFFSDRGFLLPRMMCRGDYTRAIDIEIHIRNVLANAFL